MYVKVCVPLKKALYRLIKMFKIDYFLSCFSSRVCFTCSYYNIKKAEASDKWFNRYHVMLNVESRTFIVFRVAVMAGEKQIFLFSVREFFIKSGKY